MAHYEHLPIYKAAFDLIVYMEKIVAGFSRYNKYTLGAALRNTCLQVLLLVIKANNTNDKLPVLEDLRLKIEELKTIVRICKEVRAFPHFSAFETGINQVITIAKQNEGWMRSLAARKRPESPPHSQKDRER